MAPGLLRHPGGIFDMLLRENEGVRLGIRSRLPPRPSRNPSRLTGFAQTTLRLDQTNLHRRGVLETSIQLLPRRPHRLVVCEVGAHGQCFEVMLR